MKMLLNTFQTCKIYLPGKKYYLLKNKNSNSPLQDSAIISDKPIVRIILLAGGFIFVGIGILGMFLPLLPTTIFFLLAAWCFARSSVKFYNWLHHNKLFGKYLRSYRLEKGMTLGSKIFSVSFLWTGIILSSMFATDNIYVRMLLLIIAIGVSWHILAIKTIK